MTGSWRAICRKRCYRAGNNIPAWPLIQRQKNQAADWCSSFSFSARCLADDNRRCNAVRRTRKHRPNPVRARRTKFSQVQLLVALPILARPAAHSDARAARLNLDHCPKGRAILKRWEFPTAKTALPLVARREWIPKTPRQSSAQQDHCALARPPPVRRPTTRCHYLEP